MVVTRYQGRRGRLHIFAETVATFLPSRPQHRLGLPRQAQLDGRRTDVIAMEPPFT
jgi:hypothetical protein